MPAASGSRKIAPALALLVLAPLVGEVMSGATRVSYIVVFIPEVMVWGCGALIIREMVQRWRGGWTSMLLLGLALSVAEEFIIQQTSIAPLPWLSSTQSYGRAAGVNWVYFLYMLGFESIWIVLAPVQLTRLLFPDRQKETWLRTRGLIISGIVFLLGSFIAWFSWTQQARTKVFHAAEYHPPPALIAAGLVTTALLIAAGWALRGVREPLGHLSRKAPPPWLVGAGAFFLGIPWWVLIVLVFIPNIPVAPAVPLAAGVLWAALTFFAIRRWSSGAGWGDLHRWALVFGAILVCMVGGFGGSSVWPRVDLIGKIVLNAIAVLALIALGRKLIRQS